MKKLKPFCILLLINLVAISLIQPVNSQTLKENPELDARVKAFLNSHAGSWRDLNVPMVDGQTIYDLITKNNYKSALEIGTSTGHSGIWTAWALSKTGGKLITIEIDETRYKTCTCKLQRSRIIRVC